MKMRGGGSSSGIKHKSSRNILYIKLGPFSEVCMQDFVLDQMDPVALELPLVLHPQFFHDAARRDVLHPGDGNHALQTDTLEDVTQCGLCRLRRQTSTPVRTR